MKPTIIWFRRDLRLDDQPLLHAALQKGDPIIPVFIWAPEEEGEWAPGAASRWWLHHSLKSLQQDLAQLGLSLIIRRQPTLNALLDIAKQADADLVLWNRCYEPQVMQRDAFIKAELQKHGIHTQSSNSSLLFEPWTIFNKQDKPFQVFTPFWKHCCGLTAPEPPLPKPIKMGGYSGHIETMLIEKLELLPQIPWDIEFEEYWRPGEQGAQAHLQRSLQQVIEFYSHQRDYPSIRGTSELSPYLHFGELSPRSIWHAVRQILGAGEGATSYLRQLGWREFAYHLLYHFPQTPQEPLRRNFAAFPWKMNTVFLQAWQKGQTGYPLVDAGMRQLWRTGWMHNRVRLIVSSFLVKHLLIPWQEGAKWFWDTLVDADLANNTMGWQWIAGCGADAAPYFRIFNPVTQSEKFDENGEYIRKWVPEVQALPSPWVHQPWEAPEEVLKQAGVILGVTYPYPLVDHAQARMQALAAYATLKQTV